MKYYIIKKKSDIIDSTLINGIQSIDNSAEIVDFLKNCDIAILQRGWTRSKTAIAERNTALFEMHIPCREEYLYTDKYKVHLNSTHIEN